jgi:hypothetical protein
LFFCINKQFLFLVGAKLATNATVKVSGFAAKTVGKISKGASDYLAKKIEPSVSGGATFGGVTSGESISGGPTSGGPTFHNIIDAAHGGLLAYATIFESMEISAKILGQRWVSSTPFLFTLSFTSSILE